MTQGFAQAIESLLGEQVSLARGINVLAGKQLEALSGKFDFSAEDSLEMARMTSALEVYESEKVAMLQKAGLSMADVRALSPSVSAQLEQLRTELSSMREAIGRNAKLLDVQITRTKSMIAAVRLALGAGTEGASEYDTHGRVRGSGSGSLLGAG
jgi:hypothetical protein